MYLSLAVQTPEVKPLLPVALLSGPWEEKIDKAARLGVDGVELMTIRPQELQAAVLRQRIEQAGLKVSAVASGGMASIAGLTLLHSDPLRASQARMRLNQLIDFAGEIGAPLVTIGSFRGKLANTPGQGEALLMDILDQAAEYAMKQSVRLVLEPLNRFEIDFLHTSGEVLGFIQKIGHPNLGLLLDTFHANIEESCWDDPIKSASQAGRLWHVHIADNNRLPPGRGMLDFPAVINALQSCGYDGFLSAELLARPDPDTAATQTVDTMHKFLRM